jgi:hypothetical protein
MTTATVSSSSRNGDGRLSMASARADSNASGVVSGGRSSMVLMMPCLSACCILRCMPATRTQVYLTGDQRRRLDERGRREGRSLAHMVREAVDAYLASEPDRQAALDATFGALPELEVPSRREWERRARERIGDAAPR